MGRVEGKVALVTGAARGQGRSHAVHLAEEGADIIAVDICHDIASNDYPLARPEDLDETARLVEKHNRRIVPVQGDVRDRTALAAAVETGMSELGKLDIVVANAGICPLGAGGSAAAFIDAVDVDLIGVLNTVHVALPHLKAGASIIMTGSVAGLLSSASSGSCPQGLGGAGYNFAKRVIVEYTTTLAVKLAPQSIRVNAVHPTNCNTDMLQSDPMYRTFRPDLENPSAAEAEAGFRSMQAMPIPWVEPSDISYAVVYLASDESRYVTGMQLRVDGGATIQRGL
ncbi:3-ketoacyl-ACP reductase [Mycobacterium kansasii]|uniref:Short-chain type dehydrogenase/reductase/MSMEI_5872 n=1 Tax=Mycobacterium innocens TaxID=2341083 RepID=A0A498QJY6_9MYCO|nr:MULTISPECIES: mycofactocin-coupled SDR family oxidoreductase [Mycobacterium]KZS57886.1 3-ketoacyl-ACP reductase [Mycobacterium kansasii]VBA46022.1 Putative short-chain type dehydrogenase/reductase/MSMEI_5872 [Mycobacterium innocens]